MIIDFSFICGANLIKLNLQYPVSFIFTSVLQLLTRGTIFITAWLLLVCLFGSRIVETGGRELLPLIFARRWVNGRLVRHEHRSDWFDFDSCDWHFSLCHWFLASTTRCARLSCCCVSGSCVSMVLDFISQSFTEVAVNIHHFHWDWGE